MSKQDEASPTDAPPADDRPEVGGPKRVLSEIEFPYSDLEAASDLAVTLHRRAGGESGDVELAGWLDQSATGGTYRSRRSAARMFGLVDLAGGRVVLTPLGRDLVDDTRNRQARADAFLKPALYSALYERFRGTVLPPAEALERQIVLLGVAPKQKERARQAFQKSASYAGFIDPANGRFLRPGGVTPAASAESSARERPDEESRISAVPAEASVGGLTRLDPLLLALLEKIPDKQAGWPSAKRVRWFRAFAMNVSQVFDEDADNPVELSIDAAKSQCGSD